MKNLKAERRIVNPVSTEIRSGHSTGPRQSFSSRREGIADSRLNSRPPQTSGHLRAQRVGRGPKRPKWKTEELEVLRKRVREILRKNNNILSIPISF